MAACRDACIAASHEEEDGEVRLLRWKDVDLHAGEIRAHAKGGSVHTVPVVYQDLLAELAELSIGGKPGEYLLFPTRVGNLPGQGVIREHRDRPMQPSLCTAGGSGVSSRLAPPTSRCTSSATRPGPSSWRATGNLELTKAFMRHASITTTSESYMHLDRDDLIAAMRAAGERWTGEE